MWRTSKRETEKTERAGGRRREEQEAAAHQAPGWRREETGMREAEKLREGGTQGCFVLRVRVRVCERRRLPSHKKSRRHGRVLLFFQLRARASIRSLDVFFLFVCGVCVCVCVWQAVRARRALRAAATHSSPPPRAARRRRPTHISPPHALAPFLRRAASVKLLARVSAHVPSLSIRPSEAAGSPPEHVARTVRVGARQNRENGWSPISFPRQHAPHSAATAAGHPKNSGRRR